VGLAKAIEQLIILSKISLNYANTGVGLTGGSSLAGRLGVMLALSGARKRCDRGF